MIRLRHIPSVIFAAAMLSCCTGSDAEDTAMHKLVIRTGGARTKAAGGDLDRLSVIVYTVSGTSVPVYVKGFDAGAEDIVLNVDDGTYKVYVIGNLRSVESESLPEGSLPGFRVDYGDLDPEAIVMTAAPREVTVDADKELEFELERIAASIELEGTVSFDLSDPGFASEDPEICSIAILNIPSGCNLGTDQPSAWPDMYNCGGVTLTTEGLVDASAGHPPYSWSNPGPAAEITGPLSFLCYPNKEEESTEQDGTDYVTKLSIAFKAGGTLYFAAVGIPDPQPNHRYIINDITISRHGADEQNRYFPPEISGWSLTVSITVANWSNGQIVGSFNGTVDENGGFHSIKIGITE